MRHLSIHRHHQPSPRTEFLEGLAAFRDCTEAEVEEIDRYGVTMPIAAGKVIACQGRAARECFLIESGEVEILDGETRVGTLGPGSWIGEMAVVAGNLRCASVRTTTAVSVLTFNAAELQHLLRYVPGLSGRLRSEVAGRQAENAVTGLCQVRPGTARRRLATV